MTSSGSANPSPLLVEGLELRQSRTRSSLDLRDRVLRAKGLKLGRGELLGRLGQVLDDRDKD